MKMVQWKSEIGVQDDSIYKTHGYSWSTIIHPLNKKDVLYWAWIWWGRNSSHLPNTRDLPQKVIYTMGLDGQQNSLMMTRWRCKLTIANNVYGKESKLHIAIWNYNETLWTHVRLMEDGVVKEDVLFIKENHQCLDNGLSLMENSRCEFLHTCKLLMLRVYSLINRTY